MNACTTLLCLCLLAPLSAGAQAPAPAKPSLAQTSQATQNVAEAYFQAYIARDWDRLEPLLAEAGRFEDPTASSVFGGVGKQGKTAVMQGFREGYASINQMSFVPASKFFSGDHAVFVGELDWQLQLPEALQVRTRMPLVVRLRVRDGQVIEHIDVADYNPFVAALRAARAASKAQAGG